MSGRCSWCSAWLPLPRREAWWCVVCLCARARTPRVAFAPSVFMLADALLPLIRSAFDLSLPPSGNAPQLVGGYVLDMQERVRKRPDGDRICRWCDKIL